MEVALWLISRWWRSGFMALSSECVGGWMASGWLDRCSACMGGRLDVWLLRGWVALWTHAWPSGGVSNQRRAQLRSIIRFGGGGLAQRSCTHRQDWFHDDWADGLMEVALWLLST